MRVYTALWMIHALAPFVPTDDREVMAARKTQTIEVEIAEAPDTAERLVGSETP